MDKEDAEPSKAVAGLLEAGVLLEEFGGETQCAHVSGKSGAGLDDLLDKIMMQVLPSRAMLKPHVVNPRSRLRC